MVRSVLKSVALAALVLAAPGTARAEAPAAAAAAEALTPFERIYAEMEAGVDQEQMLSGLVATMARQLVTASPELVEAEEQFPGLSRKAAEAMRPVLRSYSARVREAYRPRFVALFAELFTPAEATDIADFYASPTGRKLLGAMSDAYDGKAMVSEAVKGGDVSDAAIKADARRAARQAVARMSEAELVALGELAQRKPVLFRLGELGTRATPLRVEMENAPLLPAEEQALERAISTAMEKHVASRAKGA